MQDGKLTAALEVLLEQLTSQMREVSETKRTINGLRRRMGEEPLFQNEDEQIEGFSSIRADQFYGKPLATAVQQYLERRKQAASVEDILRGLEQGGFDFRSLDWGETDRLRILAISLAKNNVTFHKLPNGTFGMRSWYDDTILKRAEKKANSPAGRSGRRTRQKPAKKKGLKKTEIGQSERHEKEMALAASTTKAGDSKSKPGGQGD